MLTAKDVKTIISDENLIEQFKNIFYLYPKRVDSEALNFKYKSKVKQFVLDVKAAQNKT